MSSEYNYDADAQFFPFFVVTITSLVTLPLTYSLLRTPTDKPTSSKAGRIESSFQPDHADIIDTQRARQKRKQLRVKRMVTALGGWLLIAAMIYLIAVTARLKPTVWNPYDILDIGMSATEKQINSRYRKLSTTMHPDKRKPDEAQNLTMDAINDEWVEIVKAYKALTDEDIRNNFIQYGNPDGKQSTSFGIALPQFLIADGSGKYVLAFYGLLLGIGLPWLVGSWWYGMQKMTKERVLVTTAGNLFKEYKDRMDGGDVLAAVSTALEYKDILHGSKADTGLGRVEKKLSAESNVASVPEKDLKALHELDDPVRRKALALLWAYLIRVDLDDKTLEAEKYELAPTAAQMTEAFTSISLAFGFTSPLQASHQLTQCLVQAIPPTVADRAPLLQLPHFTPQIVKALEKATHKQKEHFTIQSFMALPSEQRQTLALAAGLSAPHLATAETLARRLPFLQVERTFFKVQGEKHVIPSSLVQFVIKGRFIPPGTPASAIPAVADRDLQDPDPAEGDLKAQKIELEQHPLPLAHAPFYTQDRAPRFHVYLADTRQGKMAVPPFTFTTFDARAFADDGAPTFAVVTLKMQFAAPPQVGEYKFQMHLVCDSYLGFDVRREVIMNVEDASKAQEVEEEDDISEPEEDSIAGAMASLKGQPTADPEKPRKPATKKPAKKVDDESDYESGTDEDEDSESETDTDTDSEAEDNKGKGWWW